MGNSPAGCCGTFKNEYRRGRPPSNVDPRTSTVSSSDSDEGGGAANNPNQSSLSRGRSQLQDTSSRNRTSRDSGQRELRSSGRKKEQHEDLSLQLKNVQELVKSRYADQFGEDDSNFNVTVKLNIVDDDEDDNFYENYSQAMTRTFFIELGQYSSDQRRIKVVTKIIPEKEIAQCSRGMCYISRGTINAIKQHEKSALPNQEDVIPVTVYMTSEVSHVDSNYIDDVIKEHLVMLSPTKAGRMLLTLIAGELDVKYAVQSKSQKRQSIRKRVHKAVEKQEKYMLSYESASFDVNRVTSLLQRAVLVSVSDPISKQTVQELEAQVVSEFAEYELHQIPVFVELAWNRVSGNIQNDPRQLEFELKELLNYINPSLPCKILVTPVGKRKTNEQKFQYYYLTQSSENQYQYYFPKKPPLNKLNDILNAGIQLPLNKLENCIKLVRVTELQSEEDSPTPPIHINIINDDGKPTNDPNDAVLKHIQNIVSAIQPTMHCTIICSSRGYGTRFSYLLLDTEDIEIVKTANEKTYMFIESTNLARTTITHLYQLGIPIDLLRNDYEAVVRRKEIELPDSQFEVLGDIVPISYYVDGKEGESAVTQQERREIKELIQSIVHSMEPQIPGTFVIAPLPNRQYREIHNKYQIEFAFDYSLPDYNTNTKEYSASDREALLQQGHSLKPGNDNAFNLIRYEERKFVKDTMSGSPVVTQLMMYNQDRFHHDESIVYANIQKILKIIKPTQPGTLAVDLSEETPQFKYIVKDTLVKFVPVSAENHKGEGILIDTSNVERAAETIKQLETAFIEKRLKKRLNTKVFIDFDSGGKEVEMKRNAERVLQESGIKVPGYLKLSQELQKDNKMTLTYNFIGEILPIHLSRDIDRRPDYMLPTEGQVVHIVNIVDRNDYPVEKEQTAVNLDPNSPGLMKQVARSLHLKYFSILTLEDSEALQIFTTGRQGFSDTENELYDVLLDQLLQELPTTRTIDIMLQGDMALSKQQQHELMREVQEFLDTIGLQADGITVSFPIIANGQLVDMELKFTPKDNTIDIKELMTSTHRSPEINFKTLDQTIESNLLDKSAALTYNGQLLKRVQQWNKTRLHLSETAKGGAAKEVAPLGAIMAKLDKEPMRPQAHDVHRELENWRGKYQRRLAYKSAALKEVIADPTPSANIRVLLSHIGAEIANNAEQQLLKEQTTAFVREVQLKTHGTFLVTCLRENGQLRFDYQFAPEDIVINRLEQINVKQDVGAAQARTVDYNFYFDFESDRDKTLSTLNKSLKLHADDIQQSKNTIDNIHQQHIQIQHYDPSLRIPLKRFFSLNESVIKIIDKINQIASLYSNTKLLTIEVVTCDRKKLTEAEKNSYKMAVLDALNKVKIWVPGVIMVSQGPDYNFRLHFKPNKILLGSDQMPSPPEYNIVTPRTITREEATVLAKECIPIQVDSEASRNSTQYRINVDNILIDKNHAKIIDLLIDGQKQQSITDMLKACQNTPILVSLQIRGIAWRSLQRNIEVQKQLECAAYSMLKTINLKVPGNMILEVEEQNDHKLTILTYKFIPQHVYLTLDNLAAALSRPIEDEMEERQIYQFTMKATEEPFLPATALTLDVKDINLKDTVDTIHKHYLHYKPNQKPCALASILAKGDLIKAAAEDCGFGAFEVPTDMSKVENSLKMLMQYVRTTAGGNIIMKEGGGLVYIPESPTAAPTKRTLRFDTADQTVKDLAGYLLVDFTDKTFIDTVRGAEKDVAQPPDGVCDINVLVETGQSITTQLREHINEVLDSLDPKTPGTLFVMPNDDVAKSKCWYRVENPVKFLKTVFHGGVEHSIIQAVAEDSPYLDQKSSFPPTTPEHPQMQTGQERVQANIYFDDRLGMPTAKLKQEATMFLAHLKPKNPGILTVEPNPDQYAVGKGRPHRFRYIEKPLKDYDIVEGYGIDEKTMKKVRKIGIPVYFDDNYTAIAIQVEEMRMKKVPPTGPVSITLLPYNHRPNIRELEKIKMQVRHLLEIIRPQYAGTFIIEPGYEYRYIIGELRAIGESAHKQVLQIEQAGHSMPEPQIPKMRQKNLSTLPIIVHEKVQHREIDSYSKTNELYFDRLEQRNDFNKTDYMEGIEIDDSNLMLTAEKIKSQQLQQIVQCQMKDIAIDIEYESTDTLSELEVDEIKKRALCFIQSTKLGVSGRLRIGRLNEKQPTYYFKPDMIEIDLTDSRPQSKSRQPTYKVESVEHNPKIEGPGQGMLLEHDQKALTKTVNKINANFISIIQKPQTTTLVVEGGQRLNPKIQDKCQSQLKAINPLLPGVLALSADGKKAVFYSQKLAMQEEDTHSDVSEIDAITLPKSAIQQHLRFAATSIPIDPLSNLENIITPSEKGKAKVDIFFTEQLTNSDLLRSKKHREHLKRCIKRMKEFKWRSLLVSLNLLDNKLQFHAVSQDNKTTSKLVPNEALHKNYDVTYIPCPDDRIMLDLVANAEIIESVETSGSPTINQKTKPEVNIIFNMDMSANPLEKGELTLIEADIKKILNKMDTEMRTTMIITRTLNEEQSSKPFTYHLASMKTHDLPSSYQEIPSLASQNVFYSPPPNAETMLNILLDSTKIRPVDKHMAKIIQEEESSMLPPQSISVTTRVVINNVDDVKLTSKDKKIVVENIKDILDNIKPRIPGILVATVKKGSKRAQPTFQYSYSSTPSVGNEAKYLSPWSYVVTENNQEKKFRRSIKEHQTLKPGYKLSYIPQPTTAEMLRYQSQSIVVNANPTKKMINKIHQKESEVRDTQTPAKRTAKKYIKCVINQSVGKRKLSTHKAAVFDDLVSMINTIEPTKNGLILLTPSSKKKVSEKYKYHYVVEGSVEMEQIQQGDNDDGKDDHYIDKYNLSYHPKLDVELQMITAQFGVRLNSENMRWLSGIKTIQQAYLEKNNVEGKPQQSVFLNTVDGITAPTDEQSETINKKLYTILDNMKPSSPGIITITPRKTFDDVDFHYTVGTEEDLITVHASELGEQEEDYEYGYDYQSAAATYEITESIELTYTPLPNRNQLLQMFCSATKVGFYDKTATRLISAKQMELRQLNRVEQIKPLDIPKVSVILNTKMQQMISQRQKNTIEKQIRERLNGLGILPKGYMMVTQRLGGFDYHFCLADSGLLDISPSPDEMLPLESGGSSLLFHPRLDDEQMCQIAAQAIPLQNESSFNKVAHLLKLEKVSKRQKTTYIVMNYPYSLEPLTKHYHEMVSRAPELVERIRSSAGGMLICSPSMRGGQAGIYLNDYYFCLVPERKRTLPGSRDVSMFAADEDLRGTVYDFCFTPPPSDGFIAYFKCHDSVITVDLEGAVSKKSGLTYVVPVKVYIADGYDMNSQRRKAVLYDVHQLANKLNITGAASILITVEDDQLVYYYSPTLF